MERPRTMDSATLITSIHSSRQDRKMQFGNVDPHGPEVLHVSNFSRDGRLALTPVPRLISQASTIII